MFLAGATDRDLPPASGMAGLVRPVCLGASVGHPYGSLGSLGGFVRPAKDPAKGTGARLLLSSATALWPKRARRGDHVHQPGPVDNSLFTGETRVAFIPDEASLARPAGNEVDAAYAQVLPSVDITGNVVPDGMPGHGRAILPPGAPPRVGDLVAKVGRGTGYTVGRVAAVGSEVTVHGLDGSRAWNAPSANVTGIMEVEGEAGSFSGPGDSGAVIFRLDDGTALGLLFASSREANRSYAHDLGAVLQLYRLAWL